MTRSPDCPIEPSSLTASSMPEHEQARDGNALGVLFVDLDDFKIVNDTKGHPAGDALLQEIGRGITGVLRSADTIARLGGDEFAVLLEDLENTEEATSVAARILETVASARSLDENGIFNQHQHRNSDRTDSWNAGFGRASSRRRHRDV